MEVGFEKFSRGLLLAAGILVAIIWYYAHKQFNYWRHKGIPFGQPTFPFGNFKQTFLQRKSFGEVSVGLYESGAESVLGVWSALKPMLLIRDPEIVQHVLVKDFNSFTDRGFYIDEERDPISAHLFSFPGERWRQMRGKYSPAFTVGKIRGTFPTLVACGSALDAYVDKKANRQETIEVRELFAQYTTNVIASVGFGIEIDCIGKPDEPLRKMGRKVFQSSFKNGIRQGISFMFPQLMPWLGMKFLDWDVEKLLISMVRQNIEYRENNNVTRNDFFQLLLQLRNTGSINEDDDFAATSTTSDKKLLTIEQCTAHTFVFFGAGFETSASTMSFVLYELAKNKECLRKVHQEIDEVLAKHNDQITYEAMSDMKYLDWCIDESLRLYPPLPLINRQATAPWTIPHTDTTIEKGTAIIIPVMALHRDPKYWSQPDHFWPERFSPAQTENTTFTTRPYMPFGEGPRNCIGWRLGKQQTKMGLLVMLQKYSFDLAGISKLPIKIDPTLFIISPEGGINLKISHRRKM